MKAGIFVYVLLITQLLTGNTTKGQNNLPAENINWTINKPFEQKVFIENKGQFTDVCDIGNADIKYAVDNSIRVFFTNNSLVYKLRKIHRKATKEEHEESKWLLKNIFIKMEWLNANTSAVIEAEDRVPDYYTYGDPKNESSTIKAGAFKKIKYKNIYPNIDIEYTFHPDSGIKYNLILHPGADASLIKMKYTSDKEVFLDENGNLHLVTDMGDIIDHAPFTFYGDNKKEIESSFVVENNTVSFHLANYDNAQTIIIDPWTTNPAFAGANRAYSVDKDDMGNLYVLGGGGGGNKIFYLKKFTPAGTLLWTYTVPSITGGFYSADHTTDKAGNSYICYGPWRGHWSTKINTTGTQVFHYTTGNNSLGMAEVFKLHWNCNTGKLYGGGFFYMNMTNRPGPVFEINQTTGVYSNFSSPHPLTEIRALTSDPQGNIYALTVPLSQGGNLQGNRLAKLTSTLAPVFNVYNGYNITESGPTYFAGSPFGGYAGFNGIAADCFIYTYNGAILKRWDKNTGTQLGTNVNVIGGTAGANSGVAIDKCGDVYVGTGNSVRKYDGTLNFISSATTNTAVYDICMGNIPGEIIACGNGFIRSINMNACNQFSITATATAQRSCSSCTGAATAAAPGNCGINYLWSPSGQTTASASNLCVGTHTVQAVSACDTAIAFVNITCAAGAISLNTNHTDVLCLSPGSATVLPSGGMGAYTYSWAPGNETTQQITGLSARNYTVTVTDSIGSVSSAVVTINFNTTLVNVSLTSQQITCNGMANGSIMANSSGGSSPYYYSWSNGATTQQISALPVGAYSVLVSDSNGCTSNASASITQPSQLLANTSVINHVFCNSNNNGVVEVNASGGTAPYLYVWNNGSTNAQVSGLYAGVYTATVTDTNGCTISQSVNISQNAALSALLTFTNVLCYGTNTGVAIANVTGGTSPYSFSWSNGSSAQQQSNLGAGTYTVNITDSLGCSISDTVLINEPSALQASLTAQQAICFGQTATISSAATGGTAPYSYLWSSGGTSSAINPQPPTNSIYSLTVTDHNACQVIQTTTVIVHELPVVTFTSDTTSGCAPLCIGFVNTTPNSQTANWQSGIMSVMGDSAAFCYNQPGSYALTLTIIDNNGCSNTTEQNNYITIHPSPISSFAINPNPASATTAINCINQSIGANQWSWSFGDVLGSSSSQQNPTFIYNDSGHYQIQLIVFNEYGCSDTSSQQLYIEPEFVFYTPNTFTPNNDNTNDVFIPSGTGISTEGYELYIFDRWGNEIFKSNNLQIGWDGRTKGGANIAQIDTYIWLIKLKDIKGIPHRYIGHVNLLR